MKYVPGDQWHGDREHGHVLATQQVIADGVLFSLHAPVVQADDDGQAEHERERRALGHPAQLLHDDDGVGRRLAVYQSL